jgi:STE24 endopeptidase
MCARKMFEKNRLIWVFIFLGLLAILMLVILLFAIFLSRVTENKEVLKYFDKNFLNKAFNYNKIVLLLSICQRFIEWIFIGGIVLIIWKHFSVNPHISILKAIGYFAVFFILLYIILLPLQYYRGFIIEHHYGLSNQTPGSWLLDIAKDRAISFFISVSALTIIYLFLVYTPKYWWAITAVIFILFFILSFIISPLIIDPLFYKFEPLKDKELQTDIINIADKAGLRIDKILVADASKKTNKINAYFTGFGISKRIVIYDNLLNKYSKKEVLSVIAHEISHWKHKHIFKNIIIGIISIAFLFYILKIILTKLQLTSDIRAVFIIFILFILIEFISLPVQNAISRFFEKQADSTAVLLTEDTNTQINLFKKLAESNLAEVSPSPVIEFILYSHPSIMERINYTINYNIR